MYYRQICDDNTECGDFVADTNTEDDPGIDTIIVHKVGGLYESTDYEFKVMAVNGFDGAGGNNTSTEEKPGQTLGIHRVLFQFIILTSQYCLAAMLYNKQAI